MSRMHIADKNKIINYARQHCLQQFPRIFAEIYGYSSFSVDTTSSQDILGYTSLTKVEVFSMWSALRPVLSNGPMNMHSHT
jgi:hypothetical protein